MITFADTGIGVVYPVSVESESPSIATESLSLKRQNISFGGQRFTLSMELFPQDLKPSSLAGVIQAHIVKHGTTRSFATKMPQMIGLGDLRSDVSYRASASSAGDTTIAVTHTTSDPDLTRAEALALLSVGRYVRFTGHMKIYQITNISATSIDIYPNLRVDVAAGTVLILEPDIRVVYAESSPRGLVVNNALVIPQVSLVESL